METYFASAVESLVATLAPDPTTAQVSEAVERLAELFQRLRRPGRRPLMGLVGEVCLIRAARDAAAAIAGWHADPEERYDFVSGRLRLDVKSSGNRRRSHEISFEQANPILGCIGVLASVWIEPAGGGTSVNELLKAVEARLAGNHAAVSRLRSIVADTLGETMLNAMEWRFDLKLAALSMSFYDPAVIPAVRPPLARGVSAVRFVSDLEGCPQLDIRALTRGLDPSEAALLPGVIPPP